MIIKSRPTTLDTRIKRRPSLLIALKHLGLVLMTIIIVLNLLVVLFNFFLTVVGTP
jgi:hypothetical protein